MRVVWAVALTALLIDVQGMAMEPLSAGGLMEDIMSSVENPRLYDWRRTSIEWHLGYGYIDEANNFESEIFEMGCGFPMSSGSVPRIMLRRVHTRSTRSSYMLARTPFRQDAGVTRYELGGGIGWSLLEGRSMTRLSPWIPDLEHAMFFWSGGHYSHPSHDLIPSRSAEVEELPGQNPVNSKLVLELGLRWHLFLPRSVGLYFESLLNVPLQDTGDLKRWTSFASGVVWSVGKT